MTITSYEIAQQTGLTHAEVEHIITRFDARRIAAGGRPLEQRQTRGLRNGAPMTVCVLTDADMRFLSTCTRSRLWVRLYADHPEWCPETLSPTDMKECKAQSRAETRAARLAREKAEREAERTRRQAEREAEKRTPEWQAQEAERRRIALRNLELSNERRRREKRECEAARARARKESELEAAGLYTNGMAARRLGFADSYALTSRLRELRVITRRYTDWALLPPHDGRGYTETVTVMIGRERDTPFQTMAWTKAGLRFLRRLLADPPTV